MGWIHALVFIRSNFSLDCNVWFCITTGFSVFPCLVHEQTFQAARRTVLFFHLFKIQWLMDVHRCESGTHSYAYKLQRYFKKYINFFIIIIFWSLKTKDEWIKNTPWWHVTLKVTCCKQGCKNILLTYLILHCTLNSSGWEENFLRKQFLSGWIMMFWYITSSELKISKIIALLRENDILVKVLETLKRSSARLHLIKTCLKL